MEIEDVRSDAVRKVTGAIQKEKELEVEKREWRDKIENEKFEIDEQIR
jgi:hypothetical protein